MKFRIASVSFLNSVPLVEWFHTPAGQDQEVLFELPSRTPAMLEAGEADVALMPVAEVFRGRSGGFYPHTGIACRGAVDSVKLFSRSPLSEVRLILADRGSRSSAALVKVLLREMEGAAPDHSEVEPRPGKLPAEGEALLVIGDRCFAYERWLREEGRTEVQAHDLGLLWKELTGLPFVFAVWAVAPGFPGRVGPSETTRLGSILDQARAHGQERLKELAAREAAAGRMGYLGEVSPAAIAHYFRESLVYHLGEDELAGLRRFHELCVRHGLVPDQPLPPIL